MTDGPGVSDERHFMALLSDLQGQLDRRIETQLRELEEARDSLGAKADEIDRRLCEQIEEINARLREPEFGGVALRDYVEALFEEGKRQRDIADQEREKAAQALRAQRGTADVEREKAAAAMRGEQARAMDQAEREREKAAAAMRESLARSIQEGDDRLREHIANQIAQIAAALDSAEKLEISRWEDAERQTAALRREMQLITDASKQAVEKAEAAQRDVNEKGNQFRSQLADQATSFYPRKEAEISTRDLDRRIEDSRHERENQLGSLDQRIRGLERGESGAAGGASATEKQTARTTQILLAAIGFTITVIIIAANVLSTQ